MHTDLFVFFFSLLALCVILVSFNGEKVHDAHFRNVGLCVCGNVERHIPTKFCWSIDEFNGMEAHKMMFKTRNQNISPEINQDDALMHMHFGITTYINGNSEVFHFYFTFVS